MRVQRPSRRRFLTRVWDRGHGPLLTLGIAVVAARLAATPIGFAASGALLPLAVLYSTLAGGTVPGLLGAGIAFGALAAARSAPDAPFTYTAGDAYALLAAGIGLVAAVLLAARYRARLDRAIDRERAARDDAESARREAAAIFERITDGFLAFDRDWRVTYVNARGEEFLGRARDELLGANYWDAFPELVGSRFYVEYYRAVADRVPVRFEAESRVNPGQVLEVHAYPSEDGLSVYFQNITERKRAVEALRASEDHFRALIDNAADIIAILDPEHRIRFIGPAVERILGYAPAELIGRRLIDLVHPHDLNAADDVFERVVLTPKETTRAELRFRHRDGAWRVIEYALRNLLHDPSIRGIVINARDVTERKEAELASRASEERYRSLVNGIPIGLYRTLPDGTILDANDALVELLGYPDRQTLLDVKAVDLYVDPRDRRRFQELMEQDGSVRDFEARLVRMDGSTVPVRLNARAVVNAAGEVVHFEGAMEDITERLEAEQTARETLELYRLLQRATNDPIYDWDIAGAVLHWNEAACAVFDYAPEDIRPDLGWWTERLHPDDRERIIAGLQAAIDGGEEVWADEYRFRRGDGSYASVFDRGHIVRAEDGEPVRMIGSMIDVTERRRAEDALRQSEERYRTIFEYAGDGILITDHDGDLVQVNERACRLTGFDRDELLRMNIADLVAGDRAQNLEDYRQLVRDIGDGGHFTAADRFMRRKDGSSFQFDVNAVALESGLIMAVVRDISERARAEEERRRLEEQLRQAQKMEAVGRLAGGIAHDFNNLLTAIQGHAEVLLDGTDPEDAVRQGLDQIRRAAERAAILTHQLLAFSRRQVLQPRIIDLNRAVRDVESMLVRVIGEDIELVTGLDPGIGPVRADPGQIEQVIMNLVMNARDAMPTGGRITIETMNATLTADDVQHHDYAVQPGDYVLLTVTDTGEGMSEDVQAHIFEPFFTTKELGKGTGLGLSTVYGIVKQSGGYIWVRSEVGAGTCFRVYLPRAGACEALDAAVDDGRDEPSDALPSGTETVLLVEDEEAVRSLVRKILEQRGYCVLEARSGSEALALSAKHPGPIDLLLTDVVMPEMSGRELAERLLPDRPGTRVLFISGYTEDAVVRHGIQNTRISFLEKPFSPGALARKVREVLDMQNAPA
ncbi:MAG TPA: PAS domain S-box protein [Longimicrobiales bacterium]